MRPDGAEGIKALAPCPLRVGFLNIPGGNIVKAGIAKDVLCGVAALHGMRSLADNDAKLALIIESAADRRVNDIIAVSDNAGAGFNEQQRLRWETLIHLCCVFTVILTDCNDFCRLAGSKQAYSVPPQAFSGIFNEGKRFLF